MLAALLALGLLGAWELYARTGAVDDFILPAPTEVAQALWDDRGLLWDNLLVTAQEVVLGLALALVAALLLAVALHLWRPLRRATYPLLVGTQAIPIVTIAPLLAAWFGYGLLPKLVIVALVCFFPIVVTTLDGLASIDPDQHKLLRTLGASRWQAFRRVTLPAIRWGLVYGIVLSTARAIGEFGAVSVVSGKVSGETETLTLLVEKRFQNFDLAGAYAASTLLALIALVTLGGMVLVNRRKELS
jgi:putative hydroxymethylpyrimidine transport system permease protein